METNHKRATFIKNKNLETISQFLTQSRNAEPSFTKFSNYLVKQELILDMIISRKDNGQINNVQALFSSLKRYKSLLQKAKRQSFNGIPREISRKTNLHKAFKYKVDYCVYIFEVSNYAEVIITFRNAIQSDPNFQTFLNIIHGFIHTQVLIQKFKHQDKVFNTSKIIQTNGKAKANKEFNLKSTDRYRSIFENNSFPILTVLQGKIISYNNAAKKLLGYKDKELKTIQYIDIIHEDYKDTIMATAMRFISKKESHATIEVALVTKQNVKRDIVMSMQAMFDSNGTFEGTVCTIYDITSQKSIHNELINSNKKYKTLVEASPAGLIQIDLNDNILHCSPMAAKIFGCKQSDLINTNPYDLLKPIHRKEIENAFITLYQKGKLFEGQYLANHRKGKETIIKGTARLLRNEIGKKIGFLLMFNDVTKEQKAIEQLTKSEVVKSSLLETTTDGFLAYDTNYNIISINKYAKKLHKQNLNISLKLGDNMKDIYKKKGYLKRLKTNSDPALKRGIASTKVLSFQINNKKRYLELKTYPIKDNQKNIIGVMEVGRDVTELTKKENAIKKSEQRYRNLVDHMISGFAVIDDQGIVRFINKKGLEIFGYSSKIALKKHITSFFQKSEYSKIEHLYNSLVKRKNIKPFSLKGKHKTGKQLIIEATPIQPEIKKDQSFEVYISFIDVTEKVDAQNEKEKQRKLYEAILQNSFDGIDLIKDQPNNKYSKSDLLFRNPAMKNLFHGSEDPLMLKSKFIKYCATIQEDGIPIKILYDKLNGQLAKGKIVQHNLILKDRQNKPLYVSTTNQTITLDDESYHLRNYKNITEQVLKAKELENREATLSAVLNCTPDGIFAIDKNLVVIAVNKQAIRDFKSHLDINLKVGTDLNKVVDNKILNRWRESYFNKVFKGESIKYVGPSAEQDYYLENSYAPVITSENEIIGCLEVSRDITSLNKQEIAFKKSEEKYRLLIETSPSGIIRLDTNLEIIFASKKAANILEKNVSDLISHPMLKYIHIDDHENFHINYKKILNSKKEITHTHKLSTGNGNIKFIEAIVKKTEDEEENSSSILMVFNDITDRIESQEALQTTQLYYDKMYENTFDPIFVYDYAKEGVIDCNKAALKLFEFSNKQEVIGKSRHNILPNARYLFPDHSNSLRSKEKTTDQDPKRTSLNSTITNRKGTQLQVNINVIPTERNASEAFIIIHDNTKLLNSFQKLNESLKELEKRKAIYEALIQNSFDGIDIIQFDFKNEKFLNPKLVFRNEKMKNYLPDENQLYIAPKDFYKLLPSDNTKKYDELFYEIASTIVKDRSAQKEISLKGKNNNLLTLNTSHSMVKVDDERVLIRNFSDITERKKQEEIIKNQIVNLNSKNQELEKYIQSNMQLENFAYIASHDLKAPLRSVSSFSHLLKNLAYHKLDDKGKKFLDIIMESSQNMQRLIDDLLEYSRINTEKIRIVKLSIENLLKRIQIDLSSELTYKKVDLKILNLPETVYADESMMIQLFQNLIRNSIKFTPEDKIPTIEISSSAEEDQIQFIVKDNGIGIREEDRNKIFGIFSKLHSNDVYRGTGLGLSICKSIVERHQGKIWVESELNQGSSFYFTIKKLNG